LKYESPVTHFLPTVARDGKPMSISTHGKSPAEMLAVRAFQMRACAILNPAE